MISINHYLQKLRWKFISTLTPRRQIQSRDLRFSLSCENWITHYRCSSFNEKEPETLDWIDRYLKKNDFFLDIGANVGLYSIYGALREPSARVIALEPEYSNLHLLRDNIAANNLQNRITPYAVALSAKGGLSYLHVQDLTPGAARHTETKEMIARTQGANLVSSPVFGVVRNQRSVCVNKLSV